VIITSTTDEFVEKYPKMQPSPYFVEIKTSLLVAEEELISLNFQDFYFLFIS
jgi:hypothetical protein